MLYTRVLSRAGESRVDSKHPETQRLDKWLWAVRLCKTRGVARQAVIGGKVQVNGARAKPAKMIRCGDDICITTGPFERELRVTGLPARRGPAVEAAAMYRESQASVEKRERLARELKDQRASDPRPARRPDKRERRRIIRFTRS